MGMGETGEYREMMESLLEDLQPVGLGEPSGRADGRNVLADTALPAHP